jgi:hypothetical protein
VTTPWIVAFGLLWALVVLVVFVLVGVLRRVTNVLETAESQLTSDGSGASVMSRIPDFELYDRNGIGASSLELITEPTIVLFLESACRPCKQLAIDLDGIGESLDAVPLIVVLDDTDQGRQFPLPASVHALYDRDHVVADLFQSVVTPQAFVVDVGGLILDRKRPRGRSDLRQMAWWQREGSAPSLSSLATNGSSTATSRGS